MAVYKAGDPVGSSIDKVMRDLERQSFQGDIEAKYRLKILKDRCGIKNFDIEITHIQPAVWVAIISFKTKFQKPRSVKFQGIVANNPDNSFWLTLANPSPGILLDCHRIGELPVGDQECVVTWKLFDDGVIDRAMIQVVPYFSVDTSDTFRIGYRK